MFIKPPRNLPRLLAVFAIALTFTLPLSLPFAPEAQGQSAQEKLEQAVTFYRAENYTEAIPLFIDVAEQGNSDAQGMLGVMYQQGIGILEDYQKAAYWYRKAAEQGHAFALNNLAIMHLAGHGVKQDFPTAYALFLLSIKEGHEEAQKLANETRHTLTTEQIAAGQKIAREWQQRIEKNRKSKRIAS